MDKEYIIIHFDGGDASKGKKPEDVFITQARFMCISMEQLFGGVSSLENIWIATQLKSIVLKGVKSIVLKGG